MLHSMRNMNIPVLLQTSVYMLISACKHPQICDSSDRIGFTYLSGSTDVVAHK